MLGKPRGTGDAKAPNQHYLLQASPLAIGWRSSLHIKQRGRFMKGATEGTNWAKQHDDGVTINRKWEQTLALC